MPNEWIAAAEALALLTPFMSKDEAIYALEEEAGLGRIKTRARKYSSGGYTRNDVNLPVFFWSPGEDVDYLRQNWSEGRIATIHNENFREAEGITFQRAGVEAFLRSYEGYAEGNLRAKSKQSAGGRPPKSEAWQQWIAELVAYVHETGIPSGVGSQGQEKIINALEDRLGDNPALARSTVQPVVQAVLNRLRSA